MNKPKQWSRKYSKCIRCSTTEKKHKGNGFCINCYSKRWRKRNIEKTKKWNKIWRKNNSEKVKENGRKWVEKNIGKIKKYRKRYNEKNKEKNKKICKEYYQKNCEKCKKVAAKYRKGNPEKIKKSKNEWYKRNLQKSKENCKKWQKNNHEKINEYCKNKRENDIHFNLRCHISNVVNKKLKLRLLSKEGKTTWSFLPYTVDELIQHLENLFEPWMNWDNWGIGKGKWNIDHKKPDSLFNYKSVEDEEFQKCWALENLQPLDAIENIKKGNKIL